MDAAGARGEGLEPSITGPEPVVLPITPPPNGWTFRLAERTSAPEFGRLARDGGALNRGVPDGMMRAPGVPRDGPGFGGPRHAPVVGGRGRRGRSHGRCRPGPAVLAARHPGRTGAAGTSGLVVKVTPSRGLVNRPDRHRHRPRPAEVRRRKLPDLVRRRVHRRRPGPNEPRHRHAPLRPHRRPAAAASARNGTFSARYRVRPGSSATATAARPGTRPASSGSGPPRVWAQSCASRSRRAACRTTPTTPPRPRPRRRLTTPVPLRRRAATPGGCSR